MKRKGFTLVELLATIIVLAIVLSITLYSIIRIINSTKEKSYQVTIKNIEEHANDYLLENSERLFFLTHNANSEDDKYEYQCVTVKNLVDYGYLENNITDSKVNDDRYVSREDYIYIERNIKTKAIDKVVYDMDNQNNCDIAMRALVDISFTSVPAFDVWSKEKNVTINYRLKSLNDVNTFKDYDYNYEFKNLNNKVLSNDTFKGETVNSTNKTVKVNVNGFLGGKVILNDVIIPNSNKKEIDHIDNVGPVVVMGNYVGSKNVNNSVTIPLKVTDYGIGVNHDSFTKEDIAVTIGGQENSDIILRHVKDENYSLTINNTYYNGKVIITIGDNKVFDKLGNPNSRVEIDTGIIFENIYKIITNRATIVVESQIGTIQSVDSNEEIIYVESHVGN